MQHLRVEFLQLDRLALLQRVHDALLQRQPRALLEEGPELAAHHGLAGGQQLLGLLVGVADAALRIHGGEGLAAAQRARHAHAVPQQRARGIAGRRDLLHQPFGPDDGARLVAQRLADAAHPGAPPLHRLDLHLDVEGNALLLAGAHARGQPGAMLRNVVLQRLLEGRHVAGRRAVQARELLRPRERPVARVEAPEAHEGAAFDQFQQLACVVRDDGVHGSPVPRILRVRRLARGRA